MSHCTCKECRQLNGNYDPKCYELAQQFLEDTPNIDGEINRSRLARVIQDTIESEIEAMGWEYDEAREAR